MLIKPVFICSIYLHHNNIYFHFILQEVDAAIANQVQLSILRHLWYLTESLVVFGLFDKDLDMGTKTAMARSLTNIPKPAIFQPGKPVFPTNRFLHGNQVTLDSLIGPQSWVLFHLLGCQGNWLQLPSGQWQGNEEYRRIESLVKDLPVRIRIKDKDLFIGRQEFVVGYSKAPEQPQSSARPVCHSHAMTRTGANQPPCALLHRSSPCYALRHGRRQSMTLQREESKIFRSMQMQQEMLWTVETSSWYQTLIIWGSNCLTFKRMKWRNTRDFWKFCAKMHICKHPRYPECAVKLSFRIKVPYSIKVVIFLDKYGNM